MKTLNPRVLPLDSNAMERDVSDMIGADTNMPSYFLPLYLYSCLLATTFVKYPVNRDAM